LLDGVSCRAIALSTSEDGADTPNRHGQRNSGWFVGLFKAFNRRRLARFSLWQRRKSQQMISYIV